MSIQLSLPLIYGVQDGPAKTSAMPTQKEKDLQEKEADFSTNLWNLVAEVQKETRSSVCEGIIGDTPLVVQRYGGFGYTLAKSVCPTLRAQTGGHQRGYSDRPILCGEKFDLDRMGKADGISSRMDSRRGRLLGNAVVPGIAEWIGRQILEIDSCT